MTIGEQLTMQAIQSMARKANEFTLRDYFAGQALAGMGEYLMQNRENLNDIAESCYKVADAMIEHKKLKKVIHTLLLRPELLLIIQVFFYKSKILAIFSLIIFNSLFTTILQTQRLSAIKSILCFLI